MASLLISILVIPLLSLLVIGWRRTRVTAIHPSSTTQKRRVPPSPPTLPVIGNLHQLGTYPHKTLQTLSRRYGPFMLVHMGRAPALIVSSARLAGEVMKTHDIAFSDRPLWSTARRLLYDGKDVSLAPYGEYWRQMRSLCVLQLLNNKRVQSFSSVREEELALLVKRIGDASPTPVDMSDAFATLTNGVVCRAALGRKYGEDEAIGRRFKTLLAEFVGLLGAFNVGDLIPSLGWINKLNGLDKKVERVAKEFDDFLEQVVEEHVSKLNKPYQQEERKYNNDDNNSTRNNNDSDGDGDSDNKDFVDVLLEFQRGNLAGFPLSKLSIKAIILDIFAAGTDTTYTVLEWAMTELLKHPKVMENLQREVREVAKGRLNITDEDLDRLRYLNAVVKETLRLHPPLPLLFPRAVTRDVTINGYDVAAGTMVITNAWAIGRDPDSWGPNPDEFKPERFLGNPVDYKGQNFELIPFGAGRRGCPGIAFAMAMDNFVLANLMLRFDWALPPGMRAEDLDMTQCTGLTIHRKVPLLAVATPYSS
ncbi:cytochrome P450 71A25-like [Punica granatum]|uniref:Cytochrome P450 71A25-like n=2 Tax=Punica granatum TaxID=22663 RepID=A0A6P8EJR8_PUNGR|nr:cytochrome P450 71A25-like [Punica granatum]